MLPVEANLIRQTLGICTHLPPSHFGVPTVLLFTETIYTGRMVTWYLLMRIAFSSSLKLMCDPQRCGQTVRVCACAPTCVPSNKCGRFRESEPKQRDLPQPYAPVARRTRYVPERLAEGISFQIGFFVAQNDHCARTQSITSSLDALLQWRWYGGRSEHHSYIALYLTSVVHKTC
jgi:hypothetical protein